MSLALFVLALRHIGAARTGAHFTLAPFAGAFGAVLFLGEPITTSLIVAAALSRLLPHEQNVAPITAMALLAAAYLPSRRLSFGLPLAAWLLSDIVLYATKDAAYRQYSLATMAWVYPAVVAIAALGRWLQNRKSAARVAGGGGIGGAGDEKIITGNYEG